MAWTYDQQCRLIFERSYLKKVFPQFSWENPTSDTSVVGPLTTNSGRAYRIRIRLPRDYPGSYPAAYVISPHPLLDHRNVPVAASSHAMHTLAPDDTGHVQICHHNNESWCESILVAGVLYKLRLWLEAYEHHLLTGRPIANFLAHP